MSLSRAATKDDAMMRSAAKTSNVMAFGPFRLVVGEFSASAPSIARLLQIACGL
jgi:hypothetical protein